MSFIIMLILFEVPSAGPTNLTAWNTSSTSVHMTWNEIPFDHQNGIILGYRIYIRKGGSIGGWFVADTSEKYFTKAGLELWTMYDVKVSGRTSVGEGNLSEVFRVRTDQDGKHSSKPLYHCDFLGISKIRRD